MKRIFTAIGMEKYNCPHCSMGTQRRHEKSRINALHVYRPNINTWKCQKIAFLRRDLSYLLNLFSFLSHYITTQNVYTQWQHCLTFPISHDFTA